MVDDQKSRSRTDRPSEIPAPRGSNRIVLALLAAGLVVLAAAVAVYVSQNTGEEGAKPVVTPDEAIYVAPRPLVTAPSRPLVEAGPDAGLPAPVPPEPEKRFARPTGGERLGTVDAAAVNRLINERFGQVRACYERRLKMNPLLRGDLDLNINISTSGKVTGIGVSSDTVRDREMLDCVKKTIRGWTFPKPEGGRAVVAKNFKFKPKS